MGPSLDLFDPFDEYDLAFHPTPFPSLRWMTEPPKKERDALTGQTRRKAEKVRFTLPVGAYRPENLSVKVIGRKLVIDARQEEREGDDFNVKEFRKHYDLPENASLEHMASFVTPNGTLVVEFPLITETKERADHQHQVERYGTDDNLFNYDEFFKSTFLPKITSDEKTGEKKIDMELDMTGFRPDQIQVHVKDHDLVVQAESNYKDKDRAARSFIYKAVRLPPGANTDKMRSFLHNGKKLVITAPYNETKPALERGDPNNKITGSSSPTSSTRSTLGSTHSTLE